jgi:hypothetical protein
MRRIGRFCILLAAGAVSVVLLIAILSSFLYEPNRSKHAWTVSHMGRMRNAVVKYHDDYGKYPSHPPPILGKKRLSHLQNW